MPIDKTELKQKINDLGVKISTESEAIAKLDRVRNNLSMVLPDDFVDERTGSKMTNTTRQKIYDDNMADATTLLV